MRVSSNPLWIKTNLKFYFGSTFCLATFFVYSMIFYNIASIQNRSDSKQNKTIVKLN